MNSLKPGIIKSFFKNIPVLSENLIGIFLIMFAVFSPVSIAGTNISWVLAVVFWIVKSISEKRISIKNTPLNIPLLCLFVVIIISIITSQDIKYAIKGVRSSILFLVYFLAVNNIKDKSQIRKLLSLLALFATISAAYGVFQHFTGIDFLRDNKFLEKVLPRSTGFYEIPMTFAEHISMVLMIPAGMLLLNARKTDLKGYLRENKWWLLSFIIISAGLYYAFTRGAWIGALAGIMFLLFLKSRKAFLAGAASLILLIALLFILLPKSTITTRLSSIVSKKDKSFVQRTFIWESSLNMFRDHPITGVGWEGYKRKYPEYAKDKGRKWRKFNKKIFSHAHNNFLNIAVETGILGLGVFIWFLIVLIRESYRIYKVTGDRYLKSVCAGGLAVFIVFIVSGLTEYNFGDSEIIMLFYFLAGIVFTISKINLSEQE